LYSLFIGDFLSISRRGGREEVGAYILASSKDFDCNVGNANGALFVSVCVCGKRL